MIVKTLSFAVFVSLVGGCAKYQPMPLDAAAVNKQLAAPDPADLRVKVQSIHHPLLKPITMDDAAGITPDQAAIIAVIVNPALRAARDQRKIADAQLIAAGVLPNPQLTFSEQIPTGGISAGSINAYDLGVNWNITDLISRDARMRSARANSQSVDLDIAWQEWQTAQAARSAAYDVIALQSQVEEAEQADTDFAQSAATIQSALDRHEKTALDVAAALAASQESHSTLLTARRDLDHQRLALNRAIGLPPDAKVTLRGGYELPSHLSLPTISEILTGLENRRLDLLALQLGYQSQEETLRAAVLEQFPKINIGFDKSRDNNDVKYLGVGVGIDLPIFDRNQGTIATEKATRQKLFDEYTQRVFESRSDVAQALDDVTALSEQIAADQQAADALGRLAQTCKTAFQSGNIDALIYNQAQSDWAQKRLETLKLKQELMDNLVALELAAGEIFPVADPSAAPTSSPAGAP